MSYILEALKKAQAERQLGNAPTIHAPQAAPVAQASAAASRRPLFVGLGAGALVVVAGAVLLWRAAPAGAPAGQVAAAPAVTGPAAGAPAAGSPATGSPSVESSAAGSPAAGSPASPAASPAATAPVAPAGSAPAASAPAATLEVSAPPPPPQAEAPRVAQARPAPPLAHAPAHAPAAQPAAAAPVPAPTPAQAQAASAPVRAPAPEDSLPFLQQLPDAVQRDIPRVAFGGYMYSANPADRLLLVDKSLRHEGEEVAPGLVLEKLLPRAAVMNYRGMRFRVGL